ncbi:hypothetical protein WDU94_000351 [Cyamophila willieti]
MENKLVSNKVQNNLEQPTVKYVYWEVYPKNTNFKSQPKQQPNNSFVNEESRNNLKNEPISPTLGFNNTYQIQDKLSANVELVNNGSLKGLFGVTAVERRFSGIKEDSKVIPTLKGNDPKESIISMDKLEASLTYENRLMADFQTNTIKNETAIIATSSRILSETKSQLGKYSFDDSLKLPQLWSSIETNVSKKSSKKPFAQTEVIDLVGRNKSDLVKQGYYQIAVPKEQFDRYSVVSIHKQTSPFPVLHQHQVISYTTVHPYQSLSYITASPQAPPYQDWIRNHPHRHYLEHPETLENYQQVENQYVLTPLNQFANTHHLQHHPYESQWGYNIKNSPNSIIHPDMQFSHNHFDEATDTLNQIHTGSSHQQTAVHNVFPQSHTLEYEFPKPSRTPIILRISGGPLNFHDLHNLTQEYYHPHQPYQNPPNFSKKPLKTSNNSTRPSIVYKIPDKNVHVRPDEFANVPPTLPPLRIPSLPTTSSTFGDHFGHVKPQSTKFQMSLQPAKIASLISSGIYFNPNSNVAVPLKTKWSDSKSKLSRYASLPCNCDRDTYQCYCCVKFGLQIFNFDRTGCMNVTYDPYEFSFDWRMSWQNESLYNYTVNGKTKHQGILLSSPVL